MEREIVDIYSICSKKKSTFFFGFI